MCHARPEVPGHRQQQLTQTLFVRLLKTHFFTSTLVLKSQQNRIALLTGPDSAKREFKNLKTLKHEKMVSLVDAFETEGMFMLKFDPLPSTDVVAYLAEQPSYTEQTVAEVTLQVRVTLILNNEGQQL